MKDFPINISKLLGQTYEEWKSDHASQLAAALAYYTVFSLAPLLVIAMAVAGFFWEHSAIEEQVLTQIQGLVGADGADFIADLIRNASNPAQGFLATIFGIVILLIGALGVFNELQNDLNIIWNVEKGKTRGFLDTIKEIAIDRFLAFAMILVTGFLLLVSLLLSAILTAAQQMFTNAFAVPEFVLEIINFVVSIGVITLLFALIYKFLPDAEISWGDVWMGAFVTSILFTLGKSAIGIYLGNSAITSSFGAAGALVVILVWIYYSAQILFFGAEFTQVYAKTYGTKIRPDGQEYSVPPKIVEP
jgi:membrane protein